MVSLYYVSSLKARFLRMRCVNLEENDGEVVELAVDVADDGDLLRQRRRRMRNCVARAQNFRRLAQNQTHVLDVQNLKKHHL